MRYLLFPMIFLSKNSSARPNDPPPDLSGRPTERQTDLPTARPPDRWTETTDRSLGHRPPDFGERPASGPRCFLFYNSGRYFGPDIFASGRSAARTPFFGTLAVGATGRPDWVKSNLRLQLFWFAARLGKNAADQLYQKNVEIYNLNVKYVENKPIIYEHN